MRGLYALIDTDTLERRGLDPVRVAEAVLAARPALLQLRDKRGGGARTLTLLRALKPLAAAAGVPLFANDRPDLAMLAGCDGVHVGQEDLTIADVRALCARIGRPLRIGVSTHNRAQLEAVLAEPEGALDYVAIGPIFPTGSKEKPDPVVGLAELAALSARVADARPGLPVVAIGGITLDTAARVAAHADCPAVISALLPEPEPGGAPPALEAITARAAALQQAIVAAERAPRAASAGRGRGG